MGTKRLFKKAVNLLTLSSFLLWNLSVAAPEGGSVAQGSATISQSGAQTTINQSSQNAVINWNSFNTASHEAVQFNQPNSSAVALNRITNGLPTQFAGSLNANGQVWILNPAGVLFTNTARVDVAGLVATTHGILDLNFMNGNYRFDLVPGSEYASIINNGLISAKDSGIVALVAPHVANNGLIQANLGRVSLASGAAYTLDMYGDNLINFGSHAPIQSGSVSNAGTVIANGGKVYMTANYAAGVLDNMISMSGTVQAKSVGVNSKGEIVLYASNAQTKKLAGVTKVTGKLETASDDNSVGGFIETSGEYIDIGNTAIINAGMGGTWLVDPWNITVSTNPTSNNSGPTLFTPTGSNSNIDVSFINAQLNAGTSVSLNTASGGGEAGNININAPITATTGSASLTLTANNNININSAITLLGTFTATAGGTINLGANISAAATQTYNSPIVLTGGPITLTNTVGGFMQFNSTINGSQNLTVSFPNDTIGSLAQFNGAVGNITPLTGLTVSINSTGGAAQVNLGAVDVNGPINVSAIQSAPSGIVYSRIGFGAIGANSLPTSLTVLADASATTGGDAQINFTGAANIIGNVSLTATSNTAPAIVDFHNNPLSVTSGSLAITSTSNSGVAKSVLYVMDVSGPITISVSGVGASRIELHDDIGSVITPTSLTTSGTSLAEFNAGNNPSFSIQTQNDMTFNNPSQMFGTTSLTSTAGDVIFNSTLNGAFDLILSALSGAVTFANNVGLGSALASLDVTAGSGILINPNSVLTFSIITSGTQTYNGNVQLTLQFFPFPPLVPTDFLTSTAGDITLNGPVTLTNASGLLTLELNAANNVNINGNIFMNPTPTNAINGGRLIVSAGNLINIDTPVIEAGSVPNSGFNLGSIFFNSPIILYQDLTINTADFGGDRFNRVNSDPVGGVPYALIINTAAQVSFDSDIGTDNAVHLSQLQVNGSLLVDINADNFITVGDQLFNNAGTGFYPEPRVNNGNVTFTSLSGTVIFLQGLLASSGQSLTINGNAQLTGNFHGPFAFSSITINGNTTIPNAGANLDSASTIEFNGDLDSKIGESGAITLNAPVSVQFSGSVNGVTPLAALNINSPHIILNGATINEASRIYSQSIEVTALNGVLNAGGLIQFDNVIDGPGTLTINDSLGTVIFNSVVGNGTALDDLNVTANQINMNGSSIITDNDQTYDGAIVLGASSTLTANLGGSTIYFMNTVDGPFDLVVSAPTGEVRFDQDVGMVNALNSLAVTSGATLIYLANIQTTGDQVYNGPVVLGFNPGSTLTSIGGDITFNSAVDSDALFTPRSLTVNSNNAVVFLGDVGSLFPLNNLIINATTVHLASVVGTNQMHAAYQEYNADWIGVGTQAPFLFSNGQNPTTVKFNGEVACNDCESYGVEITVNGNLIMTAASSMQPLGNVYSLTVTGDTTLETSNLYTYGDQVYMGPVTLANNITMESVFFNITFDSTVEGPGGLTANVSNGTMFANNHMGFNTPLGYLTVNGTAQGVNIISVGDINMGPFNVVTNDLVQSLAGNVNFTSGPVTLFANLDVIAAEQIFFGAGANGVTGPFTLSAQSLNSVYGPTGQGVTGTVDVATFILGGPGGGHLSQNYPITESFVAGQGAGQAIMNTTISPDFSGSGALYCINNFCTTTPVPPVNNPFFDIPPLEMFNISTPVTCDASGCSNLEMMIDNLVEAGIVSCGGMGGCGFGFMQAQDASGVVRILMPGDVVYAGDKIMKDENSCGCIESLYSSKKVCMGPKSLSLIYR